MSGEVQFLAGLFDRFPFGDQLIEELYNPTCSIHIENLIHRKLKNKIRLL